MKPPGTSLSQPHSSTASWSALASCVVCTQRPSLLDVIMHPKSARRRFVQHDKRPPGRALFSYTAAPRTLAIRQYFANDDFAERIKLMTNHARRLHFDKAYTTVTILAHTLFTRPTVPSLDYPLLPCGKGFRDRESKALQLSTVSCRRVMHLELSPNISRFRSVRVALPDEMLWICI